MRKRVEAIMAILAEDPTKVGFFAEYTCSVRRADNVRSCYVPNPGDIENYGQLGVFVVNVNNSKYIILF